MLAPLAWVPLTGVVELCVAEAHRGFALLPVGKARAGCIAHGICFSGRFSYTGSPDGVTIILLGISSQPTH